jgi:hypothetical protein
LVDPIDGVRPISCKWFSRKKTENDGNVHIYKARLVAKAFKQIDGIDYDETFSPVMMLKSIGILLAIAIYFDYEIWKMDVNTTFLKRNLTEDVYMTQPEGFIDPKHARKICKLQKSIYGLKQASQSWNLHFDEVVKWFGIIKNVEEHCVYKKVSGSTVVFLVLYVNDILLIGLSQDAYIDKILNRFNMQDSKKGFLPISHGITLRKKQCPSEPNEQERMSAIPYASAIGSIMYDMICTCPDVSYALSAMSRYQSNYGDAHWTIVKNILKYLRRTKEAFVVFRGEEELVVKGYSDANFLTDADDSKSQPGFVFCLNGGVVNWKSSKQDTVANSMMEAEYITAFEVQRKLFGSEILFLSWVLFLVRPVLWISIVTIVEP